MLNRSRWLQKLYPLWRDRSALGMECCFGVTERQNASAEMAQQDQSAGELDQP